MEDKVLNTAAAETAVGSTSTAEAVVPEIAVGLNERSAIIDIGGEEFELMLTTRATKEIGKRYGGLENLGDKLMKSENFEMALDEIVWLITLLANQPIMIHNIKHKDAPKPLLTEEEVELLTSPLELALYKNAIMASMQRGTSRHIESEADPKNAQVG